MMANTKFVTDLSTTQRKEDLIFGEVLRHNQTGFQETTRRSTGRGRVGSISFDEADELFRSWIDENNWPYDALLFDPRIFTFIFEKTSRLISGKPQGKLIPREGSDIMAAKVNNSLLDYQWDEANRGGSMISKWALMDINARKYGSSFSLCKWRYETDDTGKVVFDGPDMQVLNNRDFAHDLTATSIESANWVQVRQYVTLQDLEQVNDMARGKPVYKNLDKLRIAIAQENQVGGGGDTRGSNYTSRNRAIARLEQDPIGKDDVFKTVEVVTEYRKDRWITFATKHGVVLRDIPNPYHNNEIPVVMLRYYVIDDDLYGLSEIEPIKGLQKAINALLCQYVDEINQQLYTPIAVGPGVRQHTLEWGKGARWIMNNPMTDFRLVESRSNAAQFFNNTYSVLVAAMMNALGESSLGVSNLQPYSNDKTATEVKALQLQRNARDQFNQIFLGESIKRQMMLWHSMNQVLLFSDPNKTTFIIRIVGKDAIDWFSNRGFNQMTGADDAVATMTTLSNQFGMPVNDFIEQQGLDPNEYLAPKYPVNTGTKSKPDIKSKMQTEPGNDGALLAIEPADLDGNFDFSIDVQSMAVNSADERRQARQTAVSLLVSNPNILMLLQQEGVQPKFKELFVSWLEDLGFLDAEKFFESNTSQQQPQQQAPGGAADMLQKLIQQTTQQQGGQPQQQPGQAQGAGVNELARSVIPQQVSGNAPTQQTLGQPNTGTMRDLLTHMAGGGYAGPRPGA